MEKKKRPATITGPDDSSAVGSRALLHGLFEQAALKYAEKIAVVHNGDSIKYSELDDRANRVSHSLLEHDVKLEEIVAISLPKSIDMIAAMLGVLKAGAAYLPVDVAYPENRKRYMLSNSGARYVFSSEQHTGATEGDATPLFVDRSSSRKYEHAVRRLEAKPGNLAYVIYTSGSTGTPNGVAIEHKSIVNTICWRNVYYAFSPADVILQVPSFSFDSSVEDIFCSLSSGAKLVLLDDREKLNPAALQRILSTNGITHMLVTPTYYKAILGETYKAMSAMRAITIAGELFDGSLVTEHYSKLPEVRLINEYGPTENSVCSTVYELSGKEVLIGKPIRNVQCYVLDDDQGEVATGEEGELYIGGMGLARGYLGNPQLTNQRFVKSADKGLLYRTGDLVKRLAGGNLIFLGRVDRQVKIRGFRIELDEIQRLLLKHENVKDAIVTAHRGRIYGYVIVRDRSCAIEQIWAYLRNHLPDYMVPSRIVETSEFFLLPNAKVDIDRLIRSTADSEALAGDSDVLDTVIALAGRHTDLSREKLAESLHENVENLGIDSINLLTLLIDLQDRFNIEFDFSALEEMSVITIERIASIVSRLQSGARVTAT